MTPSICIYGVGRSGTKLTQLLFCMALARQYGACDLAYEPFYWANRHCTQVSPLGVREHRRLPLFLSENVAMSFDSPYLREKTRLRDGVPLVSKFIRGNGRIRLIDRIVAPTLCVFVFRPLVSVLESIRRCGFDLLGKRQEYPSDQPRLAEEIRHNPELTVSRSFLDRCESTEDFNALWWLAMNEAALNGCAELQKVGRPLIVIDQRWFVAHPIDGARRLLTRAGLESIDIPAAGIYDAWMRDETVLRTVVEATSPRGFSETDECPYRDRVSCAPLHDIATRHAFEPRRPDPVLATHAFYRDIDETLWRMLRRIDPALVCAPHRVPQEAAP